MQTKFRLKQFFEHIVKLLKTIVEIILKTIVRTILKTIMKTIEATVKLLEPESAIRVETVLQLYSQMLTIADEVGLGLKFSLTNGF